mgnify:CR=1 FL=1
MGDRLTAACTQVPSTAKHSVRIRAEREAGILRCRGGLGQLAIHGTEAVDTTKAKPKEPHGRRQ